MFSNLNIDPRETLKLAELESALWAEAQVLTDQRRERQVLTTPSLGISGRWCFTDGSWKKNDLKVDIIL